MRAFIQSALLCREHTHGHAGLSGEPAANVGAPLMKLITHK